MSGRKTVLIANGFWDEEVPGGSYRMGSDFARYLAREGHDVHYLCGTHERSPVVPEMRDEVYLWRYPVPPQDSPSSLKLIRHVFASYRLARRMREARTIHVLNGHSELQYVGASQALGQEARRRYSSASPLPEETMSNGSTGRVRTALAFGTAVAIQRRVLHISESVRTYSDFGASLLRRRHEGLADGRLRVLPGWVDYYRFAGQSISRAEARERLAGFWLGTTPTFFSVRRLVARMGLEYLIEAVALLKRDGASFRMLIGGDGPKRKQLEMLIRSSDVEDRVHLLGRIPEIDLPLCYRAADCVILPTRALECFGLTILEAYAAGTPVIATPVGSIPEVVEPSLRGWMTREASAGALAERMHAFLRGELHAPEALLRRHAQAFDLESRAAALRDWLFDEATGPTRAG